MIRTELLLQVSSQSVPTAVMSWLSPARQFCLEELEALAGPEHPDALTVHF